MTAYESEAADNLRLKRAAEHVAYCRDAENRARVALADAVKSLARAREKHEAQFAECERRACERRATGLIFNTID